VFLGISVSSHGKRGQTLVFVYQARMQLLQRGRRVAVALLAENFASSVRFY